MRVRHSRTLLWKALAAFLVLPGTVALLIPWLLSPVGAEVRPVGLLPLGLGVALLLWSVWAFYSAGRGTLAPWSPPERLVTTGPYRLSRNPMYVAVIVILIGWALLFSSTTLWIYAALVTVAFQLRIIFGEEPWLAQRHGEEWRAYRVRVPRWILRSPR